MNNEKQKLLTFYTSSHKNMFNEYFKPSFNKYLKDEFELVEMEGDQICKSAIYQNDGWNESVFEKVKFIYNFMNNDKSDFFVFSDVDIEFFSSIKKILIDELGDEDIAFQCDGGEFLCSGFFICKNNEKMKKLFKKMVDDYDHSKGDQYNYNYFIKRSNVKYKFLSNKFFSIWRTSDKQRWCYEDNIIFPKYPIVVLHANWTKGVKNKEKLLNIFKYRNEIQDELEKGIKDEQLDIIKKLDKMSYIEYLYISNDILFKDKCNLLVFGAGYDSKLWININKKGRTFFLEDSEEWIDIVSKENYRINIFKVKYTTCIKNVDKYIEKYNKGEIDFLNMNIPLEIMNIKWDMILVDAPVGGRVFFDEHEYGRFQSLYAAYQLFLNNKDVTVFVHDCDRFIDKIWTKMFFGNNYSQIDTLRKYCK